VPFLGDIPVLGNLFKTSTNTNDKDELLIFVTPKIVHEGVTVY
jgi:type IV pilus assembly protein PilQ